METTESKAVIPMTTPSTVRNERILFSRSVLTAICAFSLRFMRNVDFSIGLSFLAQRFDRRQAGCFLGWVNSKKDADCGGNQLRDHHRSEGDVYRHGGGGSGESGNGVGG